MRLRWARSATRHRIARRRSGYVIVHAGLWLRVPPPPGEDDDRLLYLGDDQDGVALEVMALELEDGALSVIHATPGEVPGRVRGGEEMARVKTKSGKPLTKGRVEELAREAEQGYDLSTAKRERLPRGRPSLDKGVSPRISYRVPRGVYARAKKQAHAEGRTVSEIAREALERYVDAARS